MDFVSICHAVQNVLYYIVMITGASAVAAAILIPIWRLENPRRKHNARHN